MTNKDLRNELKHQEKQDEKLYECTTPPGVREIERRYIALLADVKNNSFYKHLEESAKTNLYVCGCGWNVITKDVDAGVTPLMIQCEQCGRFAKSELYRVKGEQQDQHTKEWYRPTLERVLKLRKKPEELNHVLRGGLLLRDIKTKQDV